MIFCVLSFHLSVIINYLFDKYEFYLTKMLKFTKRNENVEIFENKNYFEEWDCQE